jgi:WD40 repeat protein
MDRPLPGGGSGTGPDQDETIDAADGPRAPRAPTPSDDAGEPTLVDPRRYQRGEVLARGGMGQIVEARDRRLGRVVAIKELLPGRGDARALFEAEARITARLAHPAIVPVHDAGRWPSGEPFYAMKLVEGLSLEQALRTRAALADRLRLLPNVATVADALAYAHSRHVIHRDLKPANILLGEYGETVVIDWGLARDLDDPTASDGRVAGTPAYMAPEQARGEPLDERSDVYALGAVLYTVIAGSAPYREQSGRDVLEQVVSGSAPPADLRGLGCPDDLWAIIAKAMAREPGERYPSAARLAEDLRRFLDGRLIGARRYTRRERLSRWVRRHLAIVATASLAGLVLVVGGALSVRRILAEKAAAVAAHDEAVEQRAVAERGNATLHEEAGRRELLAGRSGPALAHFLVARSGGRESRALDFLVDDAARAFASQELRLALAGRVLAVGFSADAKHVLGADERGHVRVWSASSGRVEWSEDTGSAVLAAAWAPGENRLAVAGADGRVTVFGLADPKPLVVRAGGAPVGVLAWRPGGLAFGDASGELVVVDLEGGVRERARVQLGMRIDALAVSGDLVAAGGEDGSVQLVTTGPPRRLFVDARHRGVAALGFDPRGLRLVVAGQDGLAVILDVKRGAVVATLSGLRSDVRRAAFEPVRGEQVLTAGADGLAALWRADGEKLHELAGHGDALADAGFSLDGRYVISAGGDGSARVWEVDSGEEIARFEGHRGGVRRADVDPNVRRVVTGGDDGTVRVFALATGLVATLPRDAEIGALTWLADGSLVTAAAREAWRYDVDERIARARFSAHADSVVTLAHDASGARVASGGLDGSILVHPTAGGEPERHELGAPVFAVALSASGRFLAAGGDGRLRWWDRQGGGEPHDEAVDGEVNALAFLDEERLFVASGNRVRLRRVASGEPLWETPAQPAEVNALAVDARRGRLASASASAVTVWSPGAGTGFTPSAYLLGGRGRVTALDFCFDGQRLAVATQDGTLEVWSPDEGGRLLWRRHRPGALWSAGFSADGKRLAAGGDDQEVWVWNVDAPASTPTGLSRLVLERVPWRIVDERLAPYGETTP